jgi:hypothetical protein
MTEQPRDWDKELADIDRAIEKQGATAPRGAPPALPPGGATSPAPRGPALAEPAGGRGSVAMTWFWMALAVLLAAALTLWPYGKGCGLQLFFYLGAAALALLAGAAGAIHSWRSRRGLPHVVSLLVVAFAGVMAAREVLPRIGYTAAAETWLCPSIPEPAPPPSTTPSPNGA